MTPPKFESEFALLDVTKHRLSLAKHLRENGPLAVTVNMTLTQPFGSNDGTSMEFCANVTSVKVEPSNG